MDNDGPGLFVIILGIVVVIGAVRGTWQKVFTDLFNPNRTQTPAIPDSPTPGFSVPGGQNPGGACYDPSGRQGDVASDAYGHCPPGMQLRTAQSGGGTPYTSGVNATGVGALIGSDPVMTNGTAPIF